MQGQRVSNGTCVDYTPSSAVAAGQVVVQGSLVGVAPMAIAANALGSLDVDGVFDFSKAQEAITAGAAVYWDEDGNPYGGTAGTGAATATSTNNKFLGLAVEAAGETDATVRVMRYFPVSITVNHYGPIQYNPIADPGDAGAIPVTDSGYVPIVTEGAETRTLAAPTFVGQELLVYMKTDGGNCVITCATTVNETGNNTITFANTGEAIRLIAVEEGANLRWRCAVADGAALSTV